MAQSWTTVVHTQNGYSVILTTAIWLDCGGPTSLMRVLPLSGGDRKAPGWTPFSPSRADKHDSMAHVLPSVSIGESPGSMSSRTLGHRWRDGAKFVFNVCPAFRFGRFAMSHGGRPSSPSGLTIRIIGAVAGVEVPFHRVCPGLTADNQSYFIHVEANARIEPE